MSHSTPVLGVLVPCRDEASVIGRKLANLAGLAWPRSPRPHRIAVVDDGSSDGTAALARAFAGRMPPGVELSVVDNRVRPGKSGAISAGLRALSGVDVLVLTDADVVLEPGALEALAAAFAREPALAMACGAQRFVRALASDGSARGPLGARLEPAAGLYDRASAWIRRLESRFGRVFSVHGQLLAWRPAPGLEPTPGYAADDLDLMVRARLAGGRVRLVRAARFLEVKLPVGGRRERQELRRARAYVQFLGHPGLAALAQRGPLERLQVACYRAVRLLSPRLLNVLLAFAGLAAFLLTPFVAALAPVVLWLGCLVLRWSAPGRRLARLTGVIREARLAEAAGAQPDRWETPRASA